MASRRGVQAESHLPKAFTDRLEFSGLTEDEKRDIRERALAAVAKEEKARSEEAFFDAAMKDARKAKDPTLQMIDVFVDLPGHAVHILLDGVQFLHGFTYEVDSQRAATLNEIQQRAWDHEDEIGGANRNFYNKPRNTTLTRRSQNVTTARLTGV